MVSETFACEPLLWGCGYTSCQTPAIALGHVALRALCTGDDIAQCNLDTLAVGKEAVARASHRRLSFHLRCAVEQLACGTARWQSSPWLGLALTRIPKSSRWTRWAEPLKFR